MKSAITLAAGVSALALAGTLSAKDSDVVTQDFDLKGFDSIEVSGVYELDVRVGPDFSIELSGPAYEMEYVEASVRNGVLHLDQKEHKNRWRNNRQGVDAVITLPSLVGLDVSGVVEGVIAGVNSGNFEIDISGVGDMEFDGECGTLDAHVSGVGDLDADALECRVVRVRVSGVGDASVYASEEVDARVSGMGDIDVYGSPSKVSKSDSMFAEITVH